MRLRGTGFHLVSRVGSLLKPSADLGGPAARERERYRRAGLSAGTALAARGLTMIMSLATVPLTLNYLGAERYGMWLTVSSVIALLGFMDLGVGNGLLNALTRSLARGAIPTAQREISSALSVLTGLAVGLGALLVLLYPVVRWGEVFGVASENFAPEAGPAFAVWAGCFLIGVPLSVVTQVRLARQEGYIVHLTAAAGSVTAVVALLLVIATRQGLPVLVLAFGVPPLLAVAASGFVLFRREARELCPAIRRADAPTGFALVRAGSLFLVLQLSIAAAFTSDTLIVAHLVGPQGVAEYGVTSRLFMIPVTLIGLAVSPLWPAYGDAIARGDVDWTSSTLVRSLHAALVISVFASAALVTLGLPIISLWVGPLVVPPFPLLVGFGIWVVLNAVGTTVAMLLNGAHEIRLQAASAVIMAVANVAFSIWLTSRVGVAGVIWGTVVTYSLFVLAPMAVYVPRVLRRIRSNS